MISRGFFGILLVLLLAPAALAAVQKTFFVGPGGNDDNAGTQERPFATIDQARRAVREINKNMNGDIVVVLLGGTYRIDKPIAFRPEDSGGNGHSVIYRAQANETPAISGGRTITSWQPDIKGRWKAQAPADDFRQLYVSGVRATRARGPAPAGIALAGKDGYTTSAVEMADWKNRGDLEFCYLATFTHIRCKVAGVRREADHAIITMLQPFFTDARTKEGTQAGLPQYIENALELLDEFGE
ncbi:MAG: hypothetical protein WCB27_17665 [Thermoguttaceae bacterium]